MGLGKRHSETQTGLGVDWRGRQRVGLRASRKLIVVKHFSAREWMALFLLLFLLLLLLVRDLWGAMGP